MIRFTKLHGNGNDFILIDEYAGEVVPDKPGFAATYCDRRFGIGADGVLFLMKSDCADIRMRLFQPDRSEAEMCGNGIRCLVRYAIDEGYITGASAVETLAGIMEVDLDAEWIKVNMGTPAACGIEHLEGYEVYSTNTGVPHAVIFVDDLEIAIDEIAPAIRYAPVFPKGANVNFVKVKNASEIAIRTYERGVEGETLSCGTGAVASAYVAHRSGKTGDRVVVHTVGGSLRISLAADGEAFMEGAAVRVFDGTVEI
ncbi:diaminopimelate epimerase [Methanosarcinales archaeon]|nr:MAG: diaminopimelate epimerase [Methanosarcinales archaeon]